MAELRGDGGARLMSHRDFFSPKFINLLTPLSLFGAKRYLHYLLVEKLCLVIQKPPREQEVLSSKHKCKIYQTAILPEEGQIN